MPHDGRIAVVDDWKLPAVFLGGDAMQPEADLI